MPSASEGLGMTADVIRQRFNRALGAERTEKLRGETITDEERTLAGSMKEWNSAASTERRFSPEVHQVIYQLLGGEGAPRDYLDFVIGAKLMDGLGLMPGRAAGVF